MESLPVNELLRRSLSEKHTYARQRIIACCTSSHDTTAVCWTGGKDSTTLLWLVVHAFAAEGFSPPLCIYIDDGDVFPEIAAFVSELTERWNLRVAQIKNDDLLHHATAVGQRIEVQSLSRRNREELQRIGVTDPFFYFEPESLIGTHLTKSVPLAQCIEERNITHVLTGIRWDEQPTRAQEAFESIRQDPPHTRVHPILHLTERDIWDTILQENLPFCPLYQYGYRSIGAMSTTQPVDAIPAWEQDLENTSERQGRGQDKEDVMDQLRSLGYM